jgi:hypothetical protein
MSIGSDAERDTPAALESYHIEDGGFVIYDPEAEHAWIRTDHPVPLVDMV